MANSVFLLLLMPDTYNLHRRAQDAAGGGLFIQKISAAGCKIGRIEHLRGRALR